MTVMLILGRLLLLCLSIGVLGVASCRIASRLTARLELRVLAAATLGYFAAIAQALVLGLAGLGENGIALTIISLAIEIGVWKLVPRAAGPTLTTQIVVTLRALPLAGRAVLGAVLGAGLVALAYMLWRPFTPYDGLMYHLTEPAIWLHNGHPGSLVAVNQQTPVQAYPKNFEVALGWLLGLAHTAVVGTLLSFALLALGVVGMISALALLGVNRGRGALAAGAVLFIPITVMQIGGPGTDIPAVAWLTVTGALCLGAIQEKALLPVALLAAGVTLGTKATTGPAVVVMILATLFILRRSLRSRPGPLLAGAALGVGLGALWYVQTWIAYGSPLYPFYRFPSAPALPDTITYYRTSFLDAPGAALRVGTLHGYFEWFGGGAFLLAGVVLAAVVATRRHRSEQRWLTVAIGAALIELLVWSAGPFTGYPGLPDTRFFPLDGIRYLLPGLPVVALPLVLVTKRPGVARRVGDAILIACVAGNLWALRYWRVPYRPPSTYLALGVLLGLAVAGLSLALRGKHLARPQWLSSPVMAVPGIVAVAVVLTVAASGLTSRAVAIPQPPETAQFSIPTVVGWLNRQPSWTTGHQAVGAGPIIDSLLAGPAYSHRLFLVSQATSCPTLRGFLAADWLVLGVPEHGTAKYDSFYTFDRSTCLRDVTPAFTGGGFVIYRPGSR